MVPASPGASSLWRVDSNLAADLGSWVMAMEYTRESDAGKPVDADGRNLLRRVGSIGGEDGKYVLGTCADRKREGKES